MSATTPLHSDVGRRPAHLPVERIVSLFVVAREGTLFNGPDLIVAAEKAGLEFGDMGIYHRLVDGKRELGPIFSVANMLKPQLPHQVLRHVVEPLADPADGAIMLARRAAGLVQAFGWQHHEGR